MASDDSFIEAPSWLTPPASKPTEPAEPATAEADAAEPNVITLPPGIADSATHRLPPERLRPAPAKPDVVFFPVVPGPVLASPDATSSELSDATVHVSRQARAWRLVFEGSPPVVVGATLFLGRNPEPTVGHPGAPVLSLGSSAKSVSKTHAMLEVDAEGLWVHDLDSTNGVWVVPQGGEAIEVAVGQRQRVPGGADLELGDFVIQVEHG